MKNCSPYLTLEVSFGILANLTQGADANMQQHVKDLQPPKRQNTQKRPTFEQLY